MEIKPIQIFLGLLLSLTHIHSQDLDTIIHVGTHHMHFNVWKGNGTPILFESGGGNDGNVWTSLAKQVHSITGTTIITYDRVGYGKSEFNPHLPDDKKALITHGITALEQGLEKLNLFEELILVGHSYGGYYATYLASKHPSKVKGVVLIDAVTSCFHTDDFIRKQRMERTDEWLANIRAQSEPLYFECLSNIETIEIMRNHSIPSDIPVFNLVADDPPYEDPEEDNRWKACQQAFVDAHPNRTGMLASNCGHYLHFDNPKLAIDAIISVLIQSSSDAAKARILEKYISYSSEYTNTYRAQEFAYWHSERDVNRWGYTLLSEGKLSAAIHLFELNTILHPGSFNVWDSYGEALLAKGEVGEAKKMYIKSLELHPGNDNAKEMIRKIEEE